MTTTIAAGQGARYSNSLKKLRVGDRIFAYLKGAGYVGFGEILHEAVMVKDFITEDGTPLLECNLRSEKPSENSSDEKLSDYSVKVNWIKSFPAKNAKSFQGIFANQNVVCKLRHESTLKYIHKQFGTEAK
ncbi:MAG: hypothetical protein V7784_02995 [Oceanospirillaceae bacterium]